LHMIDDLLGVPQNQNMPHTSHTQNTCFQTT
jgi:hypothetical protein